MLSCCTDNLFIIGDPGGGKSFTAQEIAKTIFEGGKNVVLFPCSKISQNQSLRLAIEQYVISITRCSEDDAKSYVSSCETIILDGLDEADTLEASLINEIHGFFCEDKAKITIPSNKRKELDILPGELRDKLVLRKSSSKHILIATERLHWDETRVVSQLLFGDSEGANRKLNELRSGPRVIATCRESTNLDLGTSFRTLRLLPFSKQELSEFVQKHCEAASYDATKLLLFLDENNYIREVCSSPLTASIMIGIYLRGSNLPTCRAELYETRANLLLREWDSAKGVKRPTSGNELGKLRLVSLLAYRMHLQKVVEISRDQAISHCKQEYSEVVLGATYETLIDDLVRHHGILCRRMDQLSFGHLSHQEFFCARHILNRQKINWLAGKFSIPWWHNVINFFVGLQGTADDLLSKVQESGGLVGYERFVQTLSNEGIFSSDFSRFILDENATFDDDKSFEE